MHIAVVGLSHRTAPVEVREKLSIPEELVEKSFNNLKKIDQILEVSILSTCNRLEIYCLVKDPQLGIEEIKSFLLPPPLPKKPHPLSILIKDLSTSLVKNSS